MSFNEYLQWLITGVEDGWIKVTQKTWREYLLAKEIVNQRETYSNKRL